LTPSRDRLPEKAGLASHLETRAEIVADEFSCRVYFLGRRPEIDSMDDLVGL